MLAVYAVMLMLMPASAVLAGEVCTDADQGCVYAASLMQKDIQTPFGPGPAPAPAPGVAGLYKLAKDHVTYSEDEMDKAELMSRTEDDAAAEAASARNKAAEAGEASVAYAVSSGQHKEASEFAAEASDARAKAIVAKTNAEDAKTKYDKMASIETRAMEAASAKAKEVKKAKVLKDTKALQVKQLKASLSEIDTRCAGDKEEKKAAEDNVDMAKREKQRAGEQLSKMTQAAKEADTTWKLASEAAGKANTVTTQAIDNQTTTSILLGQEQAETAKIQVQKSLVDQAREKARTTFDTAQAKAHSALEMATEEEASASAAVTVANGMIARAKALADVVPEAGAVAAGPAR